MSDREKRPPIWAGHISLDTDRLDESEHFMLQLGMRSIAKGDDYAILELRGGTHLILSRKDKITPDQASFDLMVENLDETHRRLDTLGFSPSAIEKGRVHDSFTVHDPCGHIITFNSSHVSDFPV